MKFAVSEAFYSIQGEGKYVGVPSVFLRMFGCNFKCEGFGMPRGEKSVERLAVNPVNFTKFTDLPLVSTGCDSYSSWDPRFKRFAKHYEPAELAWYLTGLTPNENWGNGLDKNVHLVITGGEPLLGWQKLYPDLFDLLVREREWDGGVTHITFETNGTQPLRKDFRMMQNTLTEITFSVSPKLSASGEKWEDAIKPEVLAGYYFSELNSDMYLKFVVDQPDDVYEIERAVNDYVMAGVICPVYLMPVGGMNQMYQENAEKVAKMAMSRGWRYSPRLQVDLFGNNWGT